MKLRPLIILCFLISLGFNIYLLTRESEPEEEDGPKEFSLYPDDFSSLDVPISYEPEFPVFNTFSSEGEEILFADFAMKGSIYESYERRYGSPISKQLVKNIQEIVYFLNGYKLKFREGDRLTFFYEKKSEKIVYMRFRDSLNRAVSDVYLFNSSNGQAYFKSNNYRLQPCIKNGPFEGCPEVRFVYENGGLVPLFNVPKGSAVRLPFLSKIVEFDQNRTMGGTLEVTYSNYATRAFFRGLMSVNQSLRKNELYRENATVGRSGYVFSDGGSGVVYYLRKSGNTVVSPFVFHHTDLEQIPAKDQLNFMIARNFYSKMLETAQKFEEKYY
ncbi:hypothetical protein IKR20_03915 [bacterium]|nr:hypothetical protein [bacterium]